MASRLRCGIIPIPHRSLFAGLKNIKDRRIQLFLVEQMGLAGGGYSETWKSRWEILLIVVIIVCLDPVEFVMEVFGDNESNNESS